MTIKEKVEQKKEKYKIFKIGGSVLVIWGISFWVINRFVNSDYRGIVGDMFGAVNALFSGLAFAGLIYTITVQRKELSLQREAVQMQTKELSLQREAIQMQTKELEAQHIETARSADQLQMQQELLNYQLVLATVNDLVRLKNDLSLKIIQFYEKTIFNAWAANIKNYQRMMIQESNVEEARKHLKQYEDTFFLLLEVVTDSKIGNEQQDTLKKIIKVNMNDDEITILKYNALQDGNQHRQKLLLAFNLLE